VAPLVTRAIAHYLGLSQTEPLRISLPTDSAPAPFQLPTLPDSTPPAPDTTQARVDRVHTRPPTR